MNQTTLATWELDPGDGVLVQAPVPNIAEKPLAFDFDQAAPPISSDQQGTAAFRYWAAAAALRRGADFWRGLLPTAPNAQWQMGDTLNVRLDEAVDLNAYYDRQALNFFHGQGAGGSTVYSAESPDITTHEMGHAILDSLKPGFWNAASDEIAAFHESFADISAILSALQLPSVRQSVLSQAGGHFYKSSRLSRLAVQLAAAIRLIAPQAVEPDCLRNAYNSFVYQDPTGLPSDAPASQISSEAHSFSRVFTGAFYEILAGCLAARAANSSAPTPDELGETALDIARILIKAVYDAPVVPNIYSQIAAGMVQNCGSVNANYPSVMKSVFVRRSILTLHSAVTSQQLPRAATAAAVSQGISPLSLTYNLGPLALEGGVYGLDKPLFVEPASQPRPFAVAAAALDGSTIEPPSGTAAAKAFIDDLFRRGRVNYNDLGDPQGRLTAPHKLKSHYLVEIGEGYKIERLLFDCWPQVR